MPEIPKLLKVNANGVGLAVWEWPGGDPPVLFCHATGLHARCWDQTIARLGGRHSYALDMRGHGHSSKPEPPYLWHAFGADVAAIVRSLGLNRALGVGHSMGGYAVVRGAVLQPEAFSALLLIEPVIWPRPVYSGQDPWDNHFAAKRRSRWTSPDEMFERFKDRKPFLSWDRAVLRDYCQYGLLPDGDAYVLACPPEVEASIYGRSRLAESDIYDELPSIDIPVRVVRAGRLLPPGTIDMEASPTAPGLASEFRRGEDICLAGNSHFIPMEVPELVARHIRDLLAATRLGVD